MKRIIGTVNWVACLAAVAIFTALTGGSASGAEEGWMTDLPKALQTAKTDKKLVVMDFTGSDWCPPCKALHKTVLISPEFVEYAKKSLVLVEVDFPNKKPQTDELKKANQALQEKYGVEGYPTVIVLNAEGKILSKKTGYGGQTAKEFIADLEKIAGKSK